jgi:8-oxo-dGTP diphosphatase
VHVLLVRDGQVLLTRRRDTNPDFDVLISPDDLRHVHTLHVRGSGPEPCLGLFFEAVRWLGEPTNREPEKCSAGGRFALDGLPDDVIGYPAAGIHAYRHGIPFGAKHWPPMIQVTVGRVASRG